MWLILILSLFFINWVGLRDRYLTDAYPTQDVNEIVLGDLDVYKPGLEMAYLTPSNVYVVGGLTTGSWQNTSYRNPDWEVNPLIAMTVGDFDANHKGDEIVVLHQLAPVVAVAGNLRAGETGFAAGNRFIEILAGIAGPFPGIDSRHEHLVVQPRRQVLLALEFLDLLRGYLVPVGKCGFPFFIECVERGVLLL